MYFVDRLDRSRVRESEREERNDGGKYHKEHTSQPPPTMNLYSGRRSCCRPSQRCKIFPNLRRHGPTRPDQTTSFWFIEMRFSYILQYAGLYWQPTSDQILHREIQRVPIAPSLPLISTTRTMLLQSWQSTHGSELGCRVGVLHEIPSDCRVPEDCIPVSSVAAAADSRTPQEEDGPTRRPHGEQDGPTRRPQEAGQSKRQFIDFRGTPELGSTSIQWIHPRYGVPIGLPSVDEYRIAAVHWPSIEQSGNHPIALIRTREVRYMEEPRWNGLQEALLDTGLHEEPMIKLTMSKGKRKRPCTGGEGGSSSAGAGAGAGAGTGDVISHMLE